MIQLDIYITGKWWPRMANLKKQLKILREILVYISL